MVERPEGEEPAEVVRKAPGLSLPPPPSYIVLLRLFMFFCIWGTMNMRMYVFVYVDAWGVDSVAYIYA